MSRRRPLLNVGELLLRSRANGPGVRAVVWVQGCSIGCPGCINRHLIPRRRRHLVDPVALCCRLREAAPEVEGGTLSGGEPFDQAPACALFLAAARRLDWSTMVYSGYRLEDLCARGEPAIERMLEEIDLLIDGPYRSDLAADLLWRGSSNQRIHFLSDRYSPSALDEALAPREEIVFFAGAAEVERTGILSRIAVSFI